MSIERSRRGSRFEAQTVPQAPSVTSRWKAASNASVRASARSTCASPSTSRRTRSPSAWRSPGDSDDPGELSRTMPPAVERLGDERGEPFREAGRRLGHRQVGETVEGRHARSGDRPRQALEARRRRRRVLLARDAETGRVERRGRGSEIRAGERSAEVGVARPVLPLEQAAPALERRRSGGAPRRPEPALDDVVRERREPVRLDRIAARRPRLGRADAEPGVREHERAHELGAGGGECLGDEPADRYPDDDRPARRVPLEQGREVLRVIGDRARRARREAVPAKIVTKDGERLVHPGVGERPVEVLEHAVPEPQVGAQRVHERERRRGGRGRRVGDPIAPARTAPRHVQRDVPDAFDAHQNGSPT